jgi:hypothetical protein
VAATQGGGNDTSTADDTDFAEVLYLATIGTLYSAAALDAVATVAETWTDTAIRLALYLSPLVRRTWELCVSACHTIWPALT